MLSFKLTFSLSSFTFIKRLFSSSSLSAIRVVSSAYLRLLIFLATILIPACASSSPAFRMMYSAYDLPGGSDGKVSANNAGDPGSICVRKVLWRRKCQPTSILFPGKSHGQRSVVGYSPWDHKESETTEQLHFNSLHLCFMRKTGCCRVYLLSHLKIVFFYLCFSCSLPFFFVGSIYKYVFPKPAIWKNLIWGRAQSQVLSWQEFSV